ncbi:MAG: type II toxin-antitoxin system Phd/YefM family antitoxin [Acidimicrobiaceae bacterium]|nr:type II toxin-antitoxin system Phd/YefM family antitoxin [Acidimicrobiaceae bacterium]
MELTNRQHPAVASLTDARAQFSEIVDEVITTGRTFTVTKRGRPAVVMVEYDEYESLIETINILSDEATLAAIGEAEGDVRDGDLVDLE